MVTEQIMRIFLGDKSITHRPKYISPAAPQMFIQEIRGRGEGLEMFQTVPDRWLSEPITLSVVLLPNVVLWENIINPHHIISAASSFTHPNDLPNS